MRDVLNELVHTPTEEFLARRHELWEASCDAVITDDELRDALDSRSDLPRPLLPIERETLLAILGHAEFEGRDELLAQVDSATVVEYCACPCATVALKVPPDVPRASRNLNPIPTSASIVDDDGDHITSVAVFAEGGYLSALEVSLQVSPLPPIERLRFEVRSSFKR